MDMAHWLKCTLGLGCALMAGCGNLSGLDSKDSFACKAPDGVLCASMTGIYSNAQQSNLPGQRVHPDTASEKLGMPVSEQPSWTMTQPLQTGAPIRSAPRILRVWFAPWEDSDGDLHDQSYVYLSVDAGKWQIEHTRRRIADAYRPVRAPSAFTKTAPGSQDNRTTLQELKTDSSSVSPSPTSSNPLEIAERLESLRTKQGGATTPLD